MMPLRVSISQEQLLVEQIHAKMVAKKISSIFTAAGHISLHKASVISLRSRHGVTMSGLEGIAGEDW
ncbi:MAG: hypothetical protein LAQ69_36155 [Acidobacteriia bacterium]|nr:hypothetical protein [Terriglobia bacterium]